jgi:DNA-binding response OmpR family regulator
MRKKVLIVDDDPDILMLLAVVLEDAGFGAVLASDGVNAMERFQEEQPDLVVLDVMMPRQDGWTTLQKMMESSDPPGVVVLTAKRSPDDAVRAYELGARKYMTKPFEVDELLSTIRALAG